MILNRIKLMILNRINVYARQGNATFIQCLVSLFNSLSRKVTKINTVAG